MDPAAELRLLRYFVAVAEELHFGRAARRLGIAQPALSQRVRRLERALGFLLFERTSRRVALTDAGRAMLESARRSFAELDRGVETARLVAAGEVGRLTVGYVVTAMLVVLPRLVRRFRARYPGVGLRLRELSTTLQLDALRAGEVDVGFLTDPPDDPLLACRTVWEEPFVLVVPAGHALAAARRVPAARLASLAGEPFVSFPRAQTPALHDRIAALVRSWGLAPEVAQEAVSWHMLLMLVSTGMGVTVAPASVRRLRVPGVRLLDLPASAGTVRLAACTRAADAPPTARAFVEMAEQIVRG